jgi:hypothetical protein
MATSLKTTIQEVIGFIPGSMIEILSAPTALAEQAKGMDSHAKEMLFQHANPDGEGICRCWQV